ncbi:MAG: fatty acid desaturase [Verrucomicrobia bacterium]|nr:fatty acid desaturase [Verrucomicrobiota bacterium]
MPRLPWNSVSWPNSLFLVSTLLLALTGVPLYVWRYGLDWFQAILFFAFFAATGLSITVGYHRLFTHLTFKARWPIRISTLVFGAAAFENSVLCWAADHRKHHKFVDQDDDPYDISKGFFHAHIGWILSKTAAETSFEGVTDLLQDRWVRWQHQWYLPIALLASFVLPAMLGWLWAGWAGAMGAFLMAGVARVVLVHHMTFLINSWSHTWGRQPYSNRCTARDNAFLAWLTFGEGYHNFHHAFQHDYRNGVKPWQFDPTKWAIWLLHKLGLARQLRRVPNETILLAEIAEQQRQLAAKLGTRPAPVAEPIRRLLQAAQERLDHASAHWEQRRADYRLAAERRVEASREKLAELRREFHQAAERLRAAIQEWRDTHRLAQAQLA